MKRTKYFFIIFSIMLTACSVGPNYKEPDFNLPDKYDQQNDTVSSETLDFVWWKNFNDKTLNYLVKKAIFNNKDVGQSLARVNQARALARVARAELLPGFQINADFAKAQSAGARFPAGINRNFRYEAYTSGIDATWEIDVFGRLRRNLEAANADYNSRVASLHDTLRILVSEVALNYFQLRENQRQLEISNNNLKLQEETYNLVNLKYKSGVVGELDLHRSKSQLEQTKSLIPTLNAQIKSNIHRLSVLLGRQPQKLTKKLSKTKDIPSYQGTIKIGNPGEILKKRPDLIARERELAYYTALIGVNTGDLFPKISINGNVGYEARMFSDLGSKLSEVYAFSPSLSWTPFDFGSIRARIKNADERATEALFNYEQSVLLALEEVENALANFSAEREKVVYLQNSFEASKRAYQISKSQYQEGVIDFLTLLESQKTLLETEQNYTTGKFALSSSYIALYKALGGGWGEV